MLAIKHQPKEYEATQNHKASSCLLILLSSLTLISADAQAPGTDQAMLQEDASSHQQQYERRP